jgi:hypothetical protein
MVVAEIRAVPAANPKFTRAGVVGLETPGEVSAIAPSGDMKTYCAEIASDGRRLVYVPWPVALQILWSPTGLAWQTLNGDVIAEAGRLSLRPVL